MKISFLDEPELLFGGRGLHVDIRAGLSKFGAYDRGQSGVPNPICAGVVGTAKSVRGVTDWMTDAVAGVPSQESNLVELRPSFPGVNQTIFGTTLSLSSHARIVSQKEISDALSGADPLRRAVSVFIDHARDICSKPGIHVLIVAPPVEVFLQEDVSRLGPDPELDESHEHASTYTKSFHDLFKAEALDLGVPCQLIRPDTYGGGSTRKSSETGQSGSLQDHPTRAWNLCTALYYKSGGVPWRLQLDSSKLATCYVGVSFFKSLDGETVLTSVCQVFDERGEGLILQGGNARIERSDRSPHLTRDDAQQLLSTSLSAYRREHRTAPARVVMHKTSYFDSEEVQGFNDAAAEERLSVLDLVSLRKSGIRLLKSTELPARRGTYLELGDQVGVLYLSGLVPYYRIYPGFYIPRPIEFTVCQGESDARSIAGEILELSKLNFNNTRFDGGEPMTIRAARRVGDILKHVQPGKLIQSRFRFFT